MNVLGGKNGGIIGTGDGTVFSVTPTGEYTVLWAFQGDAAGQYPSGGLLHASDGYLYGISGIGTGGLNAQVFRIKPDGSSYSSVYQFAPGIIVTSFTQGLVQGNGGKLYGVISACSPSCGIYPIVYPNGAVFSLDLGLPAALPSIRYFEPGSGAAGATVLIRGDHLLGVTAVSFNGVPRSMGV